MGGRENINAVVKERGQNGAIAGACQGVLGRRLEQLAGLTVAERRVEPSLASAAARRHQGGS